MTPKTIPVSGELLHGFLRNLGDEILVANDGLWEIVQRPDGSVVIRGAVEGESYALTDDGLMVCRDRNRKVLWEQESNDRTLHYDRTCDL